MKILIAFLALSSAPAFAVSNYDALSMRLSQDQSTLEVDVAFTGCGVHQVDLLVSCARSLPAQCDLELRDQAAPSLITCQAEIKQTLRFPLANYGLDTYSSSEAVLTLEGTRNRNGRLSIKLPRQ